MNIRHATPADREAILALVPRLSERGTPPGRDQRQIEAVDLTTMAAAINELSSETAILVAEERDVVIGFIHIKTVVDYYTQTSIGHVSDIAVAHDVEGQGVGQALLDGAQAWAESRGYPLMQLYVLPENPGARRLYERLGYRAEWIKYIKPLA